MMCAHLDELGVELQRLERAGIDSLHFDIMDGHFVPNLALACSSLAALRPLTRRPFTAHFMVDNPEDYVNEAAAAGADTFVFHIEACRYPRRLARAIASAGMVPGVAISPSTAITTLETVADIPCVLVMNVEPGFAGADLIAISPARVRAVRATVRPRHRHRRRRPYRSAYGGGAPRCGRADAGLRDQERLFEGAYERGLCERDQCAAGAACEHAKGTCT